MALKKRFKKSLDSLKLPSAEELRKALASLDIKLERLLLFCSQKWCAQNEECRQGKPCYTASLFTSDYGYEGVRSGKMRSLCSL